MSGTAHTPAPTTAVIGLLSLLMTMSAAPSSAGKRSVPCSRLTVTTASAVDIPPDLSVRALQEGLNYPKRCR